MGNMYRVTTKFSVDDPNATEGDVSNAFIDNLSFGSIDAVEIESIEKIEQTQATEGTPEGPDETELPDRPEEGGAEAGQQPAGSGEVAHHQV